MHKLHIGSAISAAVVGQVRHHFRRFDSWVGASKGQDMVVIVHTYSYIHISYLILSYIKDAPAQVLWGREEGLM
jgi:hypothetical protein